MESLSTGIEGLDKLIDGGGYPKGKKIFLSRVLQVPGKQFLGFISCTGAAKKERNVP